MALRRIGKYEIVSTIGRGAMGEVFKATDPLIGRFVAIKTMTSGIVMMPELRQRFLREAQAAGRLSHPNIVTVFDFGEDHGELFLTMELLEGSDLKDLIRRHEPMTLDVKLALMDQICDGLAFAHAKGVVHRDLKPANIHVLPGGQVKIMDFGLARPSSSPSMTEVGAILGTPHYMSPEQVRGDKADARSDVFALGVVFYELLANRKPFEADSVRGVLDLVLNQDPPPLGEVLPGLPEGLALLLRRALAKDPEGRFRDAGEMREALRAVRACLTPAELEREVSAPPAETSRQEDEPRTLLTLSPSLEQRLRELSVVAGPARVPAPATVVRRAPPSAAATAPALAPAKEASVTLRVSATIAPARTVVGRRVAVGGAARSWGRGRREPVLAGITLLVLAVPLGVLLVPRIQDAAVRVAGSPSPLATLEPDRLLGAIAKGLTMASSGHPAPAAPSLSAASAVDQAVARSRGALEAGDTAAASQAVERLMALDSNHASLPAFVRQLEDLLTRRVEQATRELAEARERAAAEAAEEQRLEAEAARAAAAPSRPRPPRPAAKAAALPAAPPRYSPLDEEPLIRRTVQDFGRALAQRDVKLLRTITMHLSPGEQREVEAGGWREVSLAVTSLEIAGQRATVRVLWSSRRSDGLLSTVTRTLGLERELSGWKVRAIER